MRFSLTLLLSAASAARLVAGYWMEDIAHQGRSTFNPDPDNYVVFRNVKDYGAVGDGVADDTAAINAAISDGNRCGFGGTCRGGSTVTPANVYFPAGTYLISSPILQFYYTHLIGDPTNLPTIKGSANFPTTTTLGLIESNQYIEGDGRLSYGATNVFFRQIRNLAIDTTAVPGAAIGIHWPSSQATSITNVEFRLSTAAGNTHRGLFIEEGSGGLLSDLVFYGGGRAAEMGNQQFTARNLTFVGAQTAIHQLWNWGWTYKTVRIVDCQVGINMSASDVGSAVIIDSSFENTPVGILNGRDPAAASSPGPGQGTLLIENVDFTNVETILQGNAGVVLPGNAAGTITQSGFAWGNVYTPNGPSEGQAASTDPTSSLFPARPAALLAAGSSDYYERTKPRYESTPASAFLSARAYGALADGRTDDTAALNRLFADAAAGFADGAVAFVDAGYYTVLDTVYIPPNTRVVGEALSSVVLGTGALFSDMATPRPVVQVGREGETDGRVEWSDMLVSTRGGTAGAVLIEFNLLAADEPSGMWDVHVRVGGFAGSDMLVAQCLKTPEVPITQPDPACTAAYMGMHVTKPAGNLYIENNWLWVADHDIEDLNSTQIHVFAGRGMLIESESGAVWLVAHGAEHFAVYQYQLLNTRDVWLGHAQTETPYYQPNPPAPAPYTTVNAALADPDYAADCAAGADSALPVGDTGLAAPCRMAWAMRVLGSSNVKVYGGGFYSFFNNWSTNCSVRENAPRCQARIFAVDDSEAAALGAVEVYGLDIVAAISMVTSKGEDVAVYQDNVATFADTLAVFKAS